jgi:hypothetical protein
MNFSVQIAGTGVERHQDCHINLQKLCGALLVKISSGLFQIFSDATHNNNKGVVMFIAYLSRFMVCYALTKVLWSITNTHLISKIMKL